MLVSMLAVLGAALTSAGVLLVNLLATSGFNFRTSFNLATVAGPGSPSTVSPLSV